MAAPTAVQPYARAAYALGWATVDDPDTFPIGEAGRAGLHAAAAAAETLDGHPDLIALVAEAGRHGAAWQALHRARLRLYNKHAKLIVAAAAGLLAVLDRPALAANLLLAADQPRRIRAQQAAASLTAAAAGTPGLTAAWQEANDQAATAAAVRGRAEAAASPHNGKPPQPKTVTAGLPAAAAALGTLTVGPQWRTGQINRQAWDLSGLDLTAADNPQDLVNGSLDTLDGVAAAAEDQMHAQLGDSFVNYIQASGIDLLYWQTEEDSRVCPACFGNEDASPYLVGTDSIPEMPAHPSCRCVWA